MDDERRLALANRADIRADKLCLDAHVNEVWAKRSMKSGAISRHYAPYYRGRAAQLVRRATKLRDLAQRLRAPTQPTKEENER